MSKLHLRSDAKAEAMTREELDRLSADVQQLIDRGIPSTHLDLIGRLYTAFLKTPSEAGRRALMAEAREVLGNGADFHALDAETHVFLAEARAREAVA